MRERGEGGAARRKEEGAGGQRNVFGGISKDGFRLEVISVFVLEPEEVVNPRATVRLCEWGARTTSVREGAWQQLPRPASIYADRHLTALFAN